MHIGHFVGLGFGIFFIWLGIRMINNRDWKKKDIMAWMQYPKSVAKITGTVSSKNSNGTHMGIHYRADIWIDGQWRRGESIDTFSSKRTCEMGEEIEVAYRPIQHSEVANKLMGAMVKTILNEDWEKRKPEFHFKILDESKYVNEGKVSGEYWFFIGFGIVIIIISLLSVFGIIA